MNTTSAALDSTLVACPACGVTNRVPSARLADDPVCGRCGTELLSGQPVELTDANFDKVVRASGLPVVVDFWAPWCGPCRTMAPAYQQAAQRLEPMVRLLKVDTESAPDLGERFNIRSIPTLALFRNGRELARQPGAMDAGGIVAWTQAQLQASTPR